MWKEVFPVNVSRPIEPVTPEEFEAMDKDERLNYELIDGIVLMSPRPNEKHQRILFNLSGEIYALLKKDKRCQGYTEFEMRVDDNILIPDLMIICDQDKLTHQQYLGAPLIVFEILSPSTTQYDLLYKLNKYKSVGVAEYLILDPKAQTITVHNYVDNEASIYIIGDTIYSKAIPEVIITVADIFA